MTAEIHEPQRPRIRDELAEQPVARRQRPHLPPDLLVDAHVDEVGQPAVRPQHSQRAIPGVGQFSGGFHDPLQRRVEVQSGADRDDRVQQRLELVLAIRDLSEPIRHLLQQFAQPQP